MDGWLEELLLGILAVSLVIVFSSWVIRRFVQGRPLKPHMVMYGLCLGTGIFTIAFFMSMDIPKVAKIVTCIALGVILIFIAASREQRAKTNKE